MSALVEQIRSLISTAEKKIIAVGHKTPEHDKIAWDADVELRQELCKLLDTLPETLETTTHYKIRNPADRFSAGGTAPSFTKKGKTWRSESDLKRHLRVQARRPIRSSMPRYANCEIIAYRVELGIASIVPVSDWFDTIRTEETAKETKRVAKISKQKKDARRKQFAELSKEFGTTP